MGRGRIRNGNIFYDLPDLGMLGAGLPAGVEWPEDRPRLCFDLAARDRKRGIVVSNPLPEDKYICRINYLAGRKQVRATGGRAADAGLTLQPFRNFKEHKTLELWSHDKYFAKPFKKYMSPAHKAEARVYYKMLKDTESAVLRRGAKSVGMITMLRLPGANLPKPLHWITWVWIAPELSPAERRQAHTLLAGWMKNNSIKYVGCSVHSANVRSQKWFLKMGFKPVRVFFERVK